MGRAPRSSKVSEHAPLPGPGHIPAVQRMGQQVSAGPKTLLALPAGVQLPQAGAPVCEGVRQAPKALPTAAAAMHLVRVPCLLLACLGWSHHGLPTIITEALLGPRVAAFMQDKARLGAERAAGELALLRVAQPVQCQLGVEAEGPPILGVLVGMLLGVDSLGALQGGV